eukprot:4536897-Prymnesium_polylepis.1
MGESSLTFVFAEFARGLSVRCQLSDFAAAFGMSATSYLRHPFDALAICSTVASSMCVLWITLGESRPALPTPYE